MHENERCLRFPNMKEQLLSILYRELLAFQLIYIRGYPNIAGNSRPYYILLYRELFAFSYQWSNVIPSKLYEDRRSTEEFRLFLPEWFRICEHNPAILYIIVPGTIGVSGQRIIMSFHQNMKMNIRMKNLGCSTSSSRSCSRKVKAVPVNFTSLLVLITWRLLSVFLYMTTI